MRLLRSGFAGGDMKEQGALPCNTLQQVAVIRDESSVDVLGALQ